MYVYTRIYLFPVDSAKNKYVVKRRGIESLLAISIRTDYWGRS